MEIPNYYYWNAQTNTLKQSQYSRPRDPNTQFGQNCGELEQNNHFLHGTHIPIRQNGDPFLEKQYPRPQDPNMSVGQNGGGVDRNIPFSSTTSPPIEEYTYNDGGLMKELIGRLRNICDDDQVSPQSCIATNNHINSPPSLDLISSQVKQLPNYPMSLSQIAGNVDHQGFAQRAARFCSPVPRAPTPRPDRMVAENGDSREGSSLSEQNIAGDLCLKGQSQNGDSSKKRKLVPLVNVIEKAGVENEESNGKTSKQEDEKEGNKQNDGVKKGDTNNANNSNKGKRKSNNNIAKAEPPKDYIHVRARRGQATDSHSLAERVRREKISERMRFLQDLVPGCNKVTGKATVLDEIINYVQSLQRQVEFLSMKLATVNPRMDINLEALLAKDLFQAREAGIQQTGYPADPTFSHGYPSLPNGNDHNFSLNPLNTTGMQRNPSIQFPPMDGFADHLTQVPSFWEDDLQSIVQNQMNIAQNQAQIVPGNSPLAQMKVEL